MHDICGWRRDLKLAEYVFQKFQPFGQQQIKLNAYLFTI